LEFENIIFHEKAPRIRLIFLWIKTVFKK